VGVRAGPVRARRRQGACAVAVSDQPVVALPAIPYRGIQPFRYVDHAIFLAREDEAEDLVDLVAIYRGVMLYGASGDGKSSLINAGLLPAAARRKLAPERVRFAPRAGEEVVVERISTTEAEGPLLPSLFAGDGDEPRVVLSVAAFEERLRSAGPSHRALLIFDQFEELVTLFEDADAAEAQRDVVAMLVRLLRDALPVKLLFVFREDYLGKVKHLLRAVPELVDQALRLTPLSVQALPTIVGGPFVRYPGHFERELEPELVERACAALATRFVSGDVSLSEVETVALRLWQSDDPRALLEQRGVQGILEDYLGETLDALAPDLRAAAVALLAELVTSAGTRNVISADDLVQRVCDADPALEPELISDALGRLERESRLVRRERRRDVELYEITSEFLVPWIRRRREEARLAQQRRRDELRRAAERARDRRRLIVFGSIAAAMCVVAAVVVALALWALGERDTARHEASEAEALALASTSDKLRARRPDASLLLALAAYEEQPLPEARGSLVDALAAAAGSPGVVAILHGHADRLTDAAFSPDGRTLATSSLDGTVRLWDVAGHRPLGAPLRGHGLYVYSVAFSPDGRTLASAGSDKAIRLWDARTGQPLGAPLRGHADYVSDVAFSPDGRTLASASRDKTVRLWDVRSHKQLGGPLRGHAGRVIRVAFSPDGRVVASGSRDRTVRLWDVATRRPVGEPLRGNRDYVSGIAFSPDGRRVASAGKDKTIRLWDARTRRPLGAPLHVDARVGAVAFSPDGRMLAAGLSDGATLLWDVRSRTRLGSALRGHANAVSAVAFSPDGRTLASAGDDQTALLWDLDRHLRGSALRGHEGAVVAMAFSPDGRTVATGSEDRSVRLWDARTYRRLGSPIRVGHVVNGVAFAADGRTLATAGADGVIRLLHPGDRRVKAGLRGHRGAVKAVAFGPGATLASAGEDGTVRLWDARAGKPLGKPLRGHGSEVRSVAISPDGRVVASGSKDRTIRLWDVRSRRSLGDPLSGHTDWVNGVAFSPDGRTLASAGGDRTLRLWDVRSHRPIGVLRGHGDAVLAVGFSADGRTLASNAYGGAVRLWDVRTGTQLGGPLGAGHGPGRALAFSPDGRTLIAAEGKRVRVWERLLWRGNADVRARVCDLMGAGLSRVEWEQNVPGIAYHDECP